MSRKRKILAVTGARSEYDLLYSLYEILDKDDNIDFSIIITGAHLSENFGYSCKQVEADDFKIENKLYNLVDSNNKIGRIVSLGNQIQLLAHEFNRIKPDIIIIAGDREEAISVSMTAAFLNIPVAHFFGGDIAKDGNIDNSVRYATSKFSHLHFVTLPEHKENLIKMGETPQNIFVIGNPAIDRILSTKVMDVKEVYRSFDLEYTLNENYFVLIQHPIITQLSEQKKHITDTLEAIRDTGIRCFINYPNSDAGNKEIIETIEYYANTYQSQFVLFKNLDRNIYINLLRHSSCLLGNSSSGVVEVASLGLPVINIGERQRGRIAGKNVLYANNDKNDILKKVYQVFNDESFKKEVAKMENPYGNGLSASKAAEVLTNITIDSNLIFKNITY